jgi:hypothetical protein
MDDQAVCNRDVLNFVRLAVGPVHRVQPLQASERGCPRHQAAPWMSGNLVFYGKAGSRCQVTKTRGTPLPSGLKED